MQVIVFTPNIRRDDYGNGYGDGFSYGYGNGNGDPLVSVFSNLGSE